MKVKCPCCGQTFDSIKHPEPVIEVKNNYQPQQYKSLSYAVSSLGEERLGSSRLFSHGNVGATISQPGIQSSLPVGAMKKGYNDIFNVIDKYHGATWKQLENEANLSTATLSTRLKEGKKVGIIDEEIREPKGKKVYIKK